MSDEIEIMQGKNIADACKFHSVDHLIFSSLVYVSRGRSLQPWYCWNRAQTELTTRITASSNTLTSVKHFDSKGKIEEYIRKLEIPCSFFLPGGFMSDFWNLFTPVNAVYTMRMPFDVRSTKIPLIDAVADSGKYVVALILEGSTGVRVAASAAYYTAEEMAAVYAQTTQEPTVAEEVAEAKFAATLPEKVREEILGNMRLFSTNYGYYLGEPSDAVERGHQLLDKHQLGPVVTLERFASQKAKN